MTLSAEQIRAVITAATAMGKGGGFVFITGKAGTGKSTILRTLRESGLSLVVCAPTGLAALNVGGVTLHSQFGLPMGAAIADNAKPLDYKKEGVIQAADAVVIDEVSMVRADQLDYIDVSLRRTFNPDLPFGGITIIVFGDMWQLEPVAKREEWRLHEGSYRSPFWFDAHVFSGSRGLIGDVPPARIVTVSLEQVFRQAGDPNLIDALNLIRLGDPAGIPYINDIGAREVPKGEPIPTLCQTNARAVAINRDELAKLPDEPKCFEGELTGDFGKELPAEMNLALKVGARVMAIKNVNDQDQQVRVVNGDIGEVIRFDHRGIPVIQLQGGRVWTANPADWDKKKYEVVKEGGKKTISEQTVGSFRQIPLKLAWGITVHKSQGQTLNAAVVDFDHQSQTHGQTYVALSRVRSGDGLYLRRPLRPSDLHVNARVREFVSGDSAAPTEVRFAGLFA
jgi:hypothetical protein